MTNLGAASKVAVAAGGIFSLLATSSVLAQAVLEEIIVTALKRAESLQDAPATVTAFGADTIEEARILSMRDYVNLTSNMTLMETQNNAFAFVNIRGLAQIRNVDPTVAVVVDGVLSTTSLAILARALRRPADRSAQRAAGRPIWPQRVGRRNQYYYQAAHGRGGGLHQGRLREWRAHQRLGRRERPARRRQAARPDRRWLPGRRRLARQRRDGREGRSV